MTRFNLNKTISCNSYGITILHGDANKHQFIKYETPKWVKKIQIEGTVKYQNIEKFKLNKKQKDLYFKVIYGLKAYSAEELATMSKNKKSNVILTYTRAQNVLRNWKQDLTFSLIDGFFTSLFPKSPVTKVMVNTKGYLNDEDSNISFKELGVQFKDVVNKLIESGLLPKNFYNLV